MNEGFFFDDKTFIMMIEVIMNRNQIKALILHNQHLTNPTSMKQVVKDMCGLQAQYYYNPKEILRIRSNDFNGLNWQEDCIKTWTLRGTLHMIHKDDFNLFMSLHTQPSYFAKFFNKDIQQQLKKDIDIFLKDHSQISRIELKEFMEANGYDQTLIKYATNGWGGIFMQLAYEGRFVFADITSRNFKYADPQYADKQRMEETEAKKMLLFRYFKHYGPASLDDAAYFLKFKKREIKALIPMLPLQCCQLQNKTYYYEEVKEPIKRIPTYLFLAPFDPLMLGYEKTTSLFLPNEYIRGIFNLTGIVFAPILYQGNVIGKWKKDKQVLHCIMFRNISESERKQLINKACKSFDSIHDVQFQYEIYES